MDTKRYKSGNDIHRILSGMITDQIVCSRIASKWNPPGLFDSSDANLIGTWCINYLRKYGKVPNNQIESIFESWAGKENANEDTVRNVEKILRITSDKYISQDSPPSSDYLLDVANNHFNKVKMRQVVEQINDDLDHDEITKAQSRFSEITKVELGAGSLIKPAEDYDVWRQAFDSEQRKQLVTYPGYLNSFLGKAMVRDSLIAFMSPDKVGKTSWLIDLSYRAVRKRRRVAYFECGDMSRDGVLRRLGSRACRRPLEASTCKIPISVDKSGKVEYEERTFKEGLTSGEAYKAFKKVTDGRDVFRLACYPNSSINVAGIESNLRDWGREEWVPDVVVIDYADILAPPTGIRETLDQIDFTWKHLRRLNQELHCLVVTATQSSAAAYGEKQRLLTRRHFSGRKTKLAHVNGMVGLNVSSEDKRNGVTRINWVVKRDGYYNDQQYVVVAGCLDIACPAIKTRER